ncbi:MAG TPA: MmgE/PrpD family protein [Ramlibacter sp.]|nr:MmgE/PrpD family protein [Ramlibacter sp.]
MKAAERIAAFASSLQPAQLTPELLQATGRALLDTYACAIAGRNEEATQLAMRYARASALPAPGRAARDWGTGAPLPLELAALVNGVAGHVLDYDDVTSPMRGHPSIALLPALVGLAEASDASGAELACAYVAGFEVICKLSKAIAVKHYARGWHSTSSIGTIAAAAACARLLRLDARRTTHAIGLAVAQAAGSRANFGTHAKSFQAGQANAAGLRAALLAAEGFDAAAGVLDDAFGYLDLYGNGESLAPQVETIGTAPLELLASGIEVKKYPLCYATHRALDGVLDLRGEHGLTLADVGAVHVRTSAGALTPLIHMRPQTGLEGKFSMQYALTAALLDGAVLLSSFTDAAVRRPEAQPFFASVTTDDATDSPTFPRWTEITLTLKNGSRLQRRVDLLRGSAQSPLSLQELRVKLEDCLAWGEAHADVDRLFGGALALDRITVREWLDIAAPNRGDKTCH